MSPKAIIVPSVLGCTSGEPPAPGAALRGASHPSLHALELDLVLDFEMSSAPELCFGLLSPKCPLDQSGWDVPPT